MTREKQNDAKVKRPKASNAEMTLRIAEVRDLILKCYAPIQIVNYCHETYGIQERQARTYIEQARTLIEKVVVEDTRQAKAEYRARLMLVVKEAFEAGDLRTAMEASTRIAKLDGVDRDETTLILSKEIVQLLQAMGVSLTDTAREFELLVRRQFSDA